MHDKKKMIRPFKEIEALSISEKNQYYSVLREECVRRNKKTRGLSNGMLLIAPILRSFPIEIQDEDNIPEATNCLFVCNHSNSHDIFVMKEALARLKKRSTILVAWDGLNIFSRFIFFIGDITFIERSDKSTIEKGILDFSSKIINGMDGVIFGEATWNLHPWKPMQKIKAGAASVSLITERPLVPVVLEYIEVPHAVKKEKNLYTKCVIRFGKPIYSSIDNNIFEQTGIIQESMEVMRKSMWEEYGIEKHSEDINEELYLNHLYVKKFKAAGFKYDSDHEYKFLLEKENEYCRDSEGNFVPGILREK